MSAIFKLSFLLGSLMVFFSTDANAVCCNRGNQIVNGNPFQTERGCLRHANSNNGFYWVNGPDCRGGGNGGGCGGGHGGGTGTCTGTGTSTGTGQAGTGTGRALELVQVRALELVQVLVPALVLRPIQIQVLVELVVKRKFRKPFTMIVQILC
jgi:hypothetical protein